MPAVGLGYWKVEKSAAAALTVEAVKSGYRHLDCAADYGNETYGVGYAYGYSPLGPFKKWPTPILSSALAVAGPGHQCVIEDASGQPWMVYHAWQSGNTGYPNGQRSLRLDRLTFKDGVPSVKPTTNRQAAPDVRAVSAK